MALEQVYRGARRRSFYSTPSRRRRTRVLIVAGLLMGFVALAWAWAFQRGPSAGSGPDVPLLAADPQPTRERPTDPGGMKVADIDPLSYDSGRSPPKIESILPAPEKPLPQPEVEQHAMVAPQPPTDAAPQAASPPPPKADQMADATPPALPPVKVAPEPAPSAPHAAPPSTMVTRQAEVVAPSKPKPKPIVAREEAKSKPMAVAPGGYRLQLASLHSAADARMTEERLRRNYGDVLGAVNFTVVPVNLGDRGTYYRVMTGPMSQGSASQICDSLRQRGAACILAKP